MSQEFKIPENVAIYLLHESAQNGFPCYETRSFTEFETEMAKELWVQRNLAHERAKHERNMGHDDHAIVIEANRDVIENLLKRVGCLTTPTPRREQE